MMTLRSRFTAGFILVIVAANIILAVATTLYVRRILLQEVQGRVQMAMSGALRDYDARLTSEVGFLETVAVQVAADELSTNRLDSKVLRKTLDTLFHERDLDFLSLIRPDGTVAYRVHNPAIFNDRVVGIRVVERALQEGKAFSGTQILTAETLANESAALAERATIPLQDPDSTTDQPETRGLVMGAAVPVFSLGESKEPLGVLFAGDLLNQRYDLVDQIRDEMFPNPKQQGRPIGTTTIFLGDLRISTNVHDKQGERAIGTRMSSTVSSQVLERGMTWDDRALVLDDWFITSYEPIRDVDGAVVGALYIGLLEKPFTQPTRVITLFFVIMISLMAAGKVLLLYIVTRALLRPVDRMVETCRQVTAGNLSARIGTRPSGEMGELCEAIDRMAGAMEEREVLVKKAAQEHILQSEKQASIGRLAAGIAHEINNPLTGVLTFSHLLRQRTEDPVCQEHADIVIRETTRVRDIVRGLLDFARESPISRTAVDINDTLERTLTLVHSQKEFRGVILRKDMEAGLPPVQGDRNQLQQVFLNLAINACEAMKGDGLLVIETRLGGNDSVVICFTDSGTGIKKENLSRIFDPFYTTKAVGKGTGLGLSISLGIIEKHGGSLEAESEEGKGSTFVVRLPLNPPETEKDQ